MPRLPGGDLRSARRPRPARAPAGAAGGARAAQGRGVRRRRGHGCRARLSAAPQRSSPRPLRSPRRDRRRRRPGRRRRRPARLRAGRALPPSAQAANHRRSGAIDERHLRDAGRPGAARAGHAGPSRRVERRRPPGAPAAARAAARTAGARPRPPGQRRGRHAQAPTTPPGQASDAPGQVRRPARPGQTPPGHQVPPGRSARRRVGQPPPGQAQTPPGQIMTPPGPGPDATRPDEAGAATGRATGERVRAAASPRRPIRAHGSGPPAHAQTHK